MLTKNTFVEEMRKQYVLVARAKGLSQKRVLYKHIFRNALIPLVTGFPAAFVGAFFAGSVLIETLFSLDGLGLLAYESVVRRDYPVVLGSLYLFTLIGLVVKLVVRPALRAGRPARAVRERRPMRTRHDAVDRRPAAAERRARRAGPVDRCRRGCRRRAVAVAEPARLGPLPAQPARHLVALVLRRAAGACRPSAELISNDRPLLARYDGQLYVPLFRNQPETRFGGDFAHADRLERPVHPRAVRQAGQLGASSR